MKKSLITFFIFSFVSLGLFAKENQNSTNDSIIFGKLTNDSIIFGKLINDYGTIVLGSDGSCEFRFTNKMKSALVIHNVKASCGCTVADWPKEPIPAGKTGVIKVKYNTNIAGPFHKTITVNSNAKNPTVVLQIKGNVVSGQ